MHKTARPARKVLKAAAQSGIGVHPILIDGNFRLPWKLHEPFGFGDSWPTYTVDPMLRILATPPQRPTQWPLIWQTWERERQARKVWHESIRLSIIRINSSEARTYFLNVVRFKDALRPRFDFVNLDPLQIGIEDVPPYRPHVGQLSTEERWEYYSLADLLVRVMLPHLLPRELKQKDRTWAHLMSRFEQYERIGPHRHESERLRRRNAFLLAVYERTLACRARDENESTPADRLLKAFTEFSALRLRGQS